VEGPHIGSFFNQGERSRVKIDEETSRKKKDWEIEIWYARNYEGSLAELPHLEDPERR